MVTEFCDTNADAELQPLRVSSPIANCVDLIPGHANAFAAWKSILGEHYVHFHAEARAAYARTASPCGTFPAGVLQPQSSSEIQAIVDIAQRFNVTLYPISRGNNWGYGEACAPTNGQVVVDLSRMNRISDFDIELGIVTVEPGVTQQQLHNFLAERAAPFMVPTHGGGPDCSLVGNLLERGYGITPIADHFGAVTSLEAVLPNGQLYRSALMTQQDGRVDRLFKWGIGPYLDGLFSQSNLGIVTRATIVLARRPTDIEAFLFTVDSDKSLPEVISRLRTLISTVGSTVGSINLMNRLRVMAMTLPYPKELLGDSTTLPDQVIEEIGRREGIAAWTGAGAIYGSRNIVAAVRREIKRILGPAVRELRFVDRSIATRASNLLARIPARFGRRLRNRLDTLNGFLDIASGKPSRVALPLAYWIRGRDGNSSAQLNPAHDGCGLIWYSPLVPMSSETVSEYITMVTSVCRSNGIEPLITLTSLSERLFDSTVPILYIRHDAQSARQAEKCFSDLFCTGRTIGCVPYRLGVNNMHLTSEFAPEFWRLVKKIKSSIDPLGTIAPGRYCPLDS